MRLPRRSVVVLGCIVMITAAGCSAVSGGPKKVVINERVCASVTFLRMNVGETNRIVLDAETTSEGARSMSFRMPDFPVVVKGDVPPNSTLGTDVSTITLTAESGKEASVDVVPTRAGNFTAVCGVVTSARIVAKDITFQILQN